MNGRRDAVAAPLLTLRPPAPRTTAGRCQLSRQAERRRSLGEGVGRCRRSRNWLPSEGGSGVTRREAENRQRWKREKGGDRKRLEETKWLHRSRASPRSCYRLWRSTCSSSALCSPSPRGLQEGFRTERPPATATETPGKSASSDSRTGEKMQGSRRGATGIYAQASGI